LKISGLYKVFPNQINFDFKWISKLKSVK